MLDFTKFHLPCDDNKINDKLIWLGSHAIGIFQINAFATTIEKQKIKHLSLVFFIGGVMFIFSKNIFLKYYFSEAFIFQGQFNNVVSPA